MDQLAFGTISNSADGHIIETISKNTISIVFNQCKLESSLEKIRSFHERCINLYYDEIKPVNKNIYGYIFESAIRDITHYIFTSTPEDILTLGINAEVLIDKGYIRYTIIAPLYPEKIYLIEKL